MNISVQGKYLQSDKILFYGSILSLVFLVVSIIIIAFVYSRIPPFIPLYNQLPWGEARLATKNEFFILPAMMGGILFANVIAALSLYQKTPLLSRLFAATSLLTGIFGLLFVGRTVSLII